MTEEDLDKLADKLAPRITSEIETRLMLSVGHGILGFVKKAVLVGIILLAGYGAGIHFFK